MYPAACLPLHPRGGVRARRPTQSQELRYKTGGRTEASAPTQSQELRYKSGGRTGASAPTSLSVGATLAAARRHPIKKLLRLLSEEFL